MDIEDIKTNLYIKRKIGRGVGITIIVVMLFCIFYSYNGPNSKKANTIKVDYLDNIPSPDQVPATGGNKTENKGVERVVTYLSKYDTSGRVVETYTYMKFMNDNVLRPVDIGMSWGDMAKQENHEKINYSMIGDRSIRVMIRDQYWLSSVGGIDQVNMEIANVHVIPANSDIEKKVKKVVIGDYIKLEGYLADVTYTTKKEKIHYHSSLSRSDSGNGACETMYVTDIKWLEPK